ncbi:MAG: hypothetical protein U1F67_00510 [Rubrivivax sp.]
MARKILTAVFLLLLGGLAGNGIARYAQGRHQHPRAVMVLAQFHLQALRAAVAGGQCPAVTEERARLVQMHAELVRAFPLAYRQDADFRRFADAMRATAQGTGAVDCAHAAADARAIATTCEDCHREFR